MRCAIAGSEVEEGPRDLGGRQAAERAQRQRHPGLRRQRRMAAGEDQPQPVVGDRAHRRASSPSSAAPGASAPARQLLLVARGRGGCGRSPCCARVVTIHAAGLARHAVARPALERDHERVLHRLLGEVEVAEHADQGGDRPSRLAPEQAVDVPAGRGRYARGLRPRWCAARSRRPRSPSPGRTSTAPSGHRDLLRPPERLVQVRAVEQVVAAELLLGLGERPVGDDRRSARGRDRRRSWRWRWAAAPRRRGTPRPR